MASSASQSRGRCYRPAGRIALIALWSLLVILVPLCWSAGGPVEEERAFGLPSALAAGNGFFTYPFRWSGDMRLLAGWQYSDGSYHGAIDYGKGASGSKTAWQRFDVLSAAPGDACWQSGGGHDPGPQVRIQHIGSFETRYQHLRRWSRAFPAARTR